ncbi:MAG: hypothetical protein MAG451_00753 [Anaerolineales bacterium]|nr:hypothetical protein [Anaerolineales bacterium]
MAQQKDVEQPSPVDEEVLTAIQSTLYDRLREPLVTEIRERLIEQAAEQPIPLYYDR